MGDDLKPPGHPIQRVDYDLAVEPRDTDNAPTLGDQRTDVRSPAAMMRQMGFDPSKNMTPLQFLIAVMNDDIDLIFKNEKRRKRMADRGGMALNYRIECAKTAAKYMHMLQPAMIVQKTDGSFGDDLSASIAAGNDRVVRKKIILETVERISPDLPIPGASYPPAFSAASPIPDAVEEDDELADE